MQWLKSTIRFCFRELDLTWIFFYGKDKILFDQAYQQSHKYYHLDDQSKELSQNITATFIFEEFNEAFGYIHSGKILGILTEFWKSFSMQLDNYTETMKHKYALQIFF